MLSSSKVDSVLFRHLTGRTKSSLVHPTAKRFDFDEWKRICANEELNNRDLTLATAAKIIGTNLNVLRNQYINGIFNGLSRQEIIDFAIADANRGWMILRNKVQETLQIEADRGQVGYIMTTGQTPLDVGPWSAPQGADALNTTLIDSLPHWFAQAVDAPTMASHKDFDYSQAAPRAQAGLSLEHALREVWQEILWEPWSIELVENGILAEPSYPDDQSLWTAWDLREQSLMIQAPLLNRHVERQLGLQDLPSIVTRTAIGIETTAEGRRIVTGTPPEKRANAHRSSIEILESAYFAPFLDQAFGNRPVTLRELQRAVCVLQDLAEIMLPLDSDPDYRTASDIERLSCSITFSDLILLFVDCLGVSAEHAVEITLSLTSNPFKDLKETFRNSLYHKPLVMSHDGGSLRIVVGALISGSPIRRTERWLQEIFASDLSKTSIGLQYESHLRELLQLALENNDMIRSVCGPVGSIPAGQAAEEIDGIIRFGSTILVLEVKCLVTPSDAIDRYDYVVKLEDACKQVARKADYIRKNSTEATSRVGQPYSGTLRVLPIVVVNQSNGSGCRIGDCVIIDAHFLILYMSTAEFRSGGALNFITPSKSVFTVRKLYSSALEAEEAIPETFETHPGLELFRSAVSWRQSNIPLVGGKNWVMSFPTMEPAKYIEAVKKREQGLPS